MKNDNVIIDAIKARLYAANQRLLADAKDWEKAGDLTAADLREERIIADFCLELLQLVEQSKKSG